MRADAIRPCVALTAGIECSSHVRCITFPLLTLPPPMQGHNHCQMSRIWFPKYLLRSPQLHSIRDAESSTMLSHLNPTLRRTGLLVMCISDRNQVRASTLFRRSVLSRRQYRLLPRPCARAMHRCLAALTAGSWTIQWCHTQVEDASPTRRWTALAWYVVAERSRHLDIIILQSADP